MIFIMLCGKSAAQLADCLRQPERRQPQEWPRRDGPQAAAPGGDDERRRRMTQFAAEDPVLLRHGRKSESRPAARAWAWGNRDRFGERGSLGGEVRCSFDGGA